MQTLSPARATLPSTNRTTSLRAVRNTSNARHTQWVSVGSMADWSSSSRYGGSGGHSIDGTGAAGASANVTTALASIAAAAQAPQQRQHW
jgi:hypothetical protein